MPVYFMIMPGRRWRIHGLRPCECNTRWIVHQRTDPNPKFLSSPGMGTL